MARECSAPATLRQVWACALMAAGLPPAPVSLATGQPSDSKRRENLSTCLSGRYPSLCDHAMLAPEGLTDGKGTVAGRFIAPPSLGSMLYAAWRSKH